VLAEAFADGPLTRRVTGSASRRARVASAARGLRAQLPLAFRHATALGCGAGAPAGVLVGARPYAHPFPAPPLLRRLAVAWGQGFGVAGRWGEVFDALLARRPERPHWYLALLGVQPSSQGRGIGSALLAAWLADVDAAAGEAWLETDEPGSLALYRAAGFEVREELRLLDVPVWLLGREAR
jgi:ribosomal protein S18 acetylase RimI-like enzyme